MLFERPVRLSWMIIAALLLVVGCGQIAQPNISPQHFSVAATLQVEANGSAIVCYPFRPLANPTSKCSGVPVDGLRAVTLGKARTFDDGSFETVPVGLLVTWDGVRVALVRQPDTAARISPSYITLWATTANATDEVAGGQPTSDGLADQSRLSAAGPQLQHDFGIVVMETGFDGIGLQVTVIAGNQTTSAYLHKHFDAAGVRSWFTPVR